MDAELQKAIERVQRFAGITIHVGEARAETGPLGSQPSIPVGPTVVSVRCEYSGPLVWRRGGYDGVGPEDYGDDGADDGPLMRAPDDVAADRGLRAALLALHVACVDAGAAFHFAHTYSGHKMAHEPLVYRQASYLADEIRVTRLRVPLHPVHAERLRALESLVSKFDLMEWTQLYALIRDASCGG